MQVSCGGTSVCVLQSALAIRQLGRDKMSQAGRQGLACRAARTVLQISSGMHQLKKKRMFLALPEAAARCVTAETFFRRMMHVRENLQYISQYEISGFLMSQVFSCLRFSAFFVIPEVCCHRRTSRLCAWAWEPHPPDPALPRAPALAPTLLLRPLPHSRTAVPADA